MVMDVKEFHRLPFDERRDQILVHRYYQGQRVHKYLVYGFAACNFYEDVLIGFNGIIPPFIKELEDQLYYHCCDCGDLFDSEIRHIDDKLGNLPRELFKGITKAFEITSGLCIECNQKKDFINN